MRWVFLLLAFGVFLPLTSYAATISGTIFEQSTGLPVANAVVSANGNVGNYGSAQTDANGQYTITGLNLDTYSVYATTNSGEAGIYPATVTIYGTADVLTVEFTLAPTGTISGVVTANDTSAGLPSLTVCAYFNKATGFCTQTDAAGQYVINGLPATTYKVKASDDSLTYVTEFYDNVIFAGSATQLNVVAGSTVSGINFGLDPSGTISGTVKDNTGTALAGIQVSAYDLATGKLYTATTDASGNYLIQGLPADDYQVQASGTSYPAVYYNDANPVTVAAGSSATSIDIVLSQVGTISGTVTDATTGQPLANAWVWANSTTTGSWVNAPTDENGYYIINNLAPDSYQVQVTAPVGYIDEFYNNAIDENNATPVTVVGGADTPNIDFALDPEGTISGTVTDSATGQPLANMNVYAYTGSDSTGWYWANSTYTDENGQYVIHKLSSGAYKIYVGDSGDYSGKYYPNTIVFGNATLISVVAGNDTPNINVAMDHGGSISGNLIDEGTGQPMANVGVFASAISSGYTYAAWTDTNGNYQIQGMAPDTYRVYAQAPSGYISVYYGNTIIFTLATPVAVSGGVDTGGIDFALAQPGGIAGTVTDAVTGLPIPGAYVCSGVSPSDYTCTGTDISGNYAFYSILPGTYGLMAWADFNNYQLQYYDHVAIQDQATPVLVASGNITSGIDFALDIDSDGDGVADADDNCPTMNNPDQADADGDGTGDVCENSMGDLVTPSLADGFNTLDGTLSPGNSVPSDNSAVLSAAELFRQSVGGGTASDADVARFASALSRIASVVFDTQSDGIADNGLNALGDLLDGFGFDPDTAMRLSYQTIEPPKTCSPALDSNGAPVLDNNSNPVQDCSLTLPATSPTSGEVLGFVQTQMTPALQAAIADLDGISPSFNFRWPNPVDNTVIEFDYGDVLFLRGIANAAIGVIGIQQAYDLNIDIAATAGNLDQMTIEQFLSDNQTVGTLAHPEVLIDAKAALAEALQNIDSAIDEIAAETDVQTDDFIQLFSTDPTEREKDIYETKRNIATALSSLNGPTTISDNDTPFDPTDDRIYDFSKFFEGLNLRNYIPGFVGDKATGMLPDPTFNGIVVKDVKLSETIIRDEDGDGIPDFLQGPNWYPALLAGKTFTYVYDQYKVASIDYTFNSDNTFDFTWSKPPLTITGSGTWVIDSQGRLVLTFTSASGSDPSIPTSVTLTLQYQSHSSWEEPSPTGPTLKYIYDYFDAFVDATYQDGSQGNYSTTLSSQVVEADSDNDGLSDGEEIALGTDPNNPDSDGDGVFDGSDANPLTTNANMLWAGVQHITQADGAEVDDLEVGIAAADVSSLGNLAASVTGPDGFNYIFTENDIHQYRPGQLTLWVLFDNANPLATGIYTFTVTDGLGGQVSRTDLHIDPHSVPLVAANTITYQRMDDGSYRFDWAPVNAARIYYYRLRIYDGANSDTIVYSGSRDADTRETIPAGILQDGTTYSVQIETCDTPSWDLIKNKGNGYRVAFTPSASDYNSQQIVLSYAKAVNFKSGDDDSYQTLLNLYVSDNSVVSLAEVDGPGGFHYTFDLTSDWFSTSNYRHSFDPGSTPTGLYTFHVVANGIDYYRYDYLTTYVDYQVPNPATYQVEDMGNGQVRFTWAPVEQPVPLWYRLVVVNVDTGATYSTARMDQTQITAGRSVLESVLGAGNWQWSVRAYDSSDWSTVHNQMNGAQIAFNLIPYDQTHPNLGVAFVSHRVDGTGADRVYYWADYKETADTLAHIQVEGPAGSGISFDLMQAGDLYQGINYEGYMASTSGLPLPGLYTFTAINAGGEQSVRYDYQSEPVHYDPIDITTLHFSRLPNGMVQVSWAPINADVPLYYRVEFLSLADYNGDGYPDEAVLSPYQTATTWTFDPSTLPEEPMVLRIRARESSGGTAWNNRIHSIYVGLEGLNFDYSSVKDSDHDGWADNVDPDDNDPNVYPLAKDTTNLDSDGDGIVDSNDNCPNVSNPQQSDVNNNGIGDACDTGSDTDGDGLTDAQEFAAGTNPILADTDGDGLSDFQELSAGLNPTVADTDGDGLQDGVDANPLTVNANIRDFSLLYTTFGDGSKSGQIAFDVNTGGAGLNGLGAVVTGPNGFSYTVQDADVSGGSFGKSFPSLEVGLYTLTVTDALGHSVSRTDNYTDLAEMSVVDTRKVRYARQADGSYLFHWPAVNPATAATYFYRLIIVDSASGQTVYKSGRTQNTTATVPVGVLVNSSTDAYRYQIETDDRDSFDLIFNRSRTNSVAFTADQGNVAGLLLYPAVYHRIEADGTQKVAVSVSLPGAIASVTSVELTGPDGYSYAFDLGADYVAFDNTLTHNFEVTDTAFPSQSGIYTFHAVIDGVDFYSDATLTPAAQYPVPDSASWQVEDLGDGTVKFSWADVNDNELLYYRVLIVDGNNDGKYYTTPRQNSSSATVNLQSLTNTLGNGPLQWRVEVHDSGSFQTLRNRVNGPLVDLVIPTYDPNKPFMSGRFNHRNYANGTLVTRHWSGIPTADFSQVLALEVTGPNNYDRNLKLNGDEYRGFNYQGYQMNEPDPVASGLYAYHLTTADGSTNTFYDTLTDQVVLPVVDARTLHIDTLGNGNQLISWAPVHASSPLWYNLLIRSVADHNQDGAPDEVFVRWSLNVPYVILPAGSLPDEPLFITLQARDASVGALENNRSVSVNVGYEGPGFDYSSLVDTDNDGWASNVDPNDNDGGVYPFASEGQPASQTFGLLDPNGGETLTSGSNYTVSWNAYPGATRYLLLYSTTGDTPWNLVSEVGNVTSTSMTVPNVVATISTVRFRIVAYNNTTWLGADDSDASVTITPPAFTLLNPNGGETLTSGSNYDVSWNAYPGANRYLLLYSTTGSTPWNLVSEVGNVTSTSITVPNVVAAVSTVRFRIVAYNNTTWLGADDSNGNVTIVPPPFALLNPNGGETLTGGSSYTVSWNAYPGANRYILLYSTTGDTPWTVLSDNGNVTSSTITVPNISSSTVRFRIVAYNNTAWLGADNSNGDIVITP